MLSKDFCKMDAVSYVAGRYGATPEEVLKRYMLQTGILKSDEVFDYELAPNEVALFRDLGIQPSHLEIK